MNSDGATLYTSGTVAVAATAAATATKQDRYEKETTD